MASLFLDLLRPSQCYRLSVGVLGDIVRGLLGNVSDKGLGLRYGGFDVQPFLELAFLIKNTPHFRTSVSSSVDRENGQSYQERVEHIMVLNNCERGAIDIDRNSGHLRTQRSKPDFQARNVAQRYGETRINNTIRNHQRGR